MEDSEKANMGIETIKNQFDLVKRKTNKSPVLEWGDLKIASEPIGNFQS